MSKDWTPRQFHNADVWAYNHRGSYIHDSSIVFKDMNGEEIEVGCKRYPEVYAKYPNLCFLWGAEYVKKNFENKGLDYLETKLSEIIAADDYDVFDKTDFGDEALVKWYEGKLDPSFYYSEENNRLLEEYLISMGKEVKK